MSKGKKRSGARPGRPQPLRGTKFDSSEISESVNFCVMEAIKLCRLDTPIIFIEARINLSRFVVTGCAAKTSATVTFPSLNLISVEFDNGDMYVDGHKAASDVRDEFVSVTEKLMDELAQCYNVLPQLDINNTIDHRPEGDEKWFLENEKTVTQFCRKLAAERPLKDIRDEY